MSENNLIPRVMHGWDIILHICTMKINMTLGVSPWTKNRVLLRNIFEGGDCEALSNNERFYISNYILTGIRRVRVSWDVEYLQGTFSPLVERSLHARACAPQSGWRFPKKIPLPVFWSCTSTCQNKQVHLHTWNTCAQTNRCQSCSLYRVTQVTRRELFLLHH